MIKKRLLVVALAGVLAFSSLPIMTYSTQAATKKMTAEEKKKQEEEEARKAEEERIRQEQEEHKYDLKALKISANKWKSSSFKYSKRNYELELGYGERQIYIETQPYNPSAVVYIDGILCTQDDGKAGAYVYVEPCTRRDIEIEVTMPDGTSGLYEVTMTRQGIGDLKYDDKYGFSGPMSTVEEKAAVLDVISSESLLRRIVLLGDKEDMATSDKAMLPLFADMMREACTDGSDFGQTLPKNKGLGMDVYSGSLYNSTNDSALLTTAQFRYMAELYFTKYSNLCDLLDESSSYGGYDDVSLYGQDYISILSLDEVRGDWYGKVTFSLSSYKYKEKTRTLTLKGFIYGTGKDGDKIKLGQLTLKFTGRNSKEAATSGEKRFGLDGYTYRESTTADAKAFRKKAGL